MLDKEILEKREKNKHIDYLHAYHITMQNHNIPTIINSLVRYLILQNVCLTYFKDLGCSIYEHQREFKNVLFVKSYHSLCSAIKYYAIRIVKYNIYIVFIQSCTSLKMKKYLPYDIPYHKPALSYIILFSAQTHGNQLHQM